MRQDPHLATRAVEAGYRGYFTTADEMSVLVQARRDGTRNSRLCTYTAPTVLVVDRLMHNAIVFNIKRHSWRMREGHALQAATSGHPR